VNRNQTRRTPQSAALKNNNLALSWKYSIHQRLPRVRALDAASGTCLANRATESPSELLHGWYALYSVIDDYCWSYSRRDLCYCWNVLVAMQFAATAVTINLLKYCYYDYDYFYFTYH